MTIDRDIMYNQSNKAAIEYAKNAIQFAFLLNGAAATALFTKVDKGYECAATWFCFGAIIAVVVMALSYVVQILVAESWRQDSDPMEITFAGKTRAISQVQMEWFRFGAMVLWILSMCFAIIGAIVASSV